jgi:alanine-synthesizing transaminase
MFAARTNWSLEPNPLSKALAERRSRNLAVLDLTETNPTCCGLSPSHEEILGALEHVRASDYQPDAHGPLAAREAVAAYYAESGARIKPEQIFLTTSTSEAYSYVFRLLADPGDQILVPRPSYPLFEFLAGLDDVTSAAYDLRYESGWQIDRESLLARAGERTRAVLVVHPNNPTGSFVSREEREFLLEICRAREIALVADEVFRDFAWSDNGRQAATHAGVADALTFTLSGLSKISALPQMKLAWIAASGPPELLKPALERLEVIADTYLSVSPPLALAAPRWLELRRAIQPRILERLKRNRDRLDREIAVSAVTRLNAAGGWYAVLRLPGIKSDEDWALAFLKEEGVLTHPGQFYDFSSDGHLVLSLLTSPEAFEEGVTRIGRAVQQRL